MVLYAQSAITVTSGRGVGREKIIKRGGEGLERK